MLCNVTKFSKDIPSSTSPRRSLDFYSPRNSVLKRMGEQASDQNVERMDLGSDNADRLSAQVKAISVLSTGKEFLKNFVKLISRKFFSDFQFEPCKTKLRISTNKSRKKTVCWPLRQGKKNSSI